MNPKVEIRFVHIRTKAIGGKTANSKITSCMELRLMILMKMPEPRFFLMCEEAGLLCISCGILVVLLWSACGRPQQRQGMTTTKPLQESVEYSFYFLFVGRKLKLYCCQSRDITSNIFDNKPNMP